MLMASEILVVCAALAPLVQALLMGLLAYPFAKGSPEKMERFRRSGFVWWIITLVVITAVGAVVAPSLFSPMAPGEHHFSLDRWVVGFFVATCAVVVLELACERIYLFKDSKAARARENVRFESSVPDKIESSFPLFLGTMSISSLFEEAVFRAVALGGLMSVWGLNKPFACGIVSICFGLGHWYYGKRQVFIKMADGAILAWCALYSGWVAAVAAHIVFNLVLMAIDYRRKARS